MLAYLPGAEGRTVVGGSEARASRPVLRGPRTEGDAAPERSLCADTQLVPALLHQPVTGEKRKPPIPNQALRGGPRQAFPGGPVNRLGLYPAPSAATVNKLGRRRQGGQQPPGKAAGTAAPSLREPPRRSTRTEPRPARPHPAPSRLAVPTHLTQPPQPLSRPPGPGLSAAAVLLIPPRPCPPRRADWRPRRAAPPARAGAAAEGGGLRRGGRPCRD